ncbi:MAG: M48 family metallopeptidase [Patescibacteria group bacterium]
MYNQIASNKRKTWLLIIIFVVLISLLGYFLGYVTSYGNGILVLAVMISIFTSLFGYFGGDKVALWSAGAQPLTKEANSYVYNIVENLCIADGLPTPKIYIIEDQAINAFATGRDPKHASIAITSGAIQKLKNEELEGVVAHELSHVKNYDIRLMTIVIVLVGIISILANWFWQASFFGGRRRSSGEGEGGAIFLIIGIVLIILSPIVATLIQLAISRKREYLADASGALLTRYPEGLANALEKIKNDPAVMKHATEATAHLYIANPFKNSKKFLTSAFSTHPDVDDRIKKLRAMT